MQRAFTTMEIIVVIAVIAILAGILTPVVLHHAEEARRDACRLELGRLRDAVLSYARQYGFRPATPGAPTQEEINRGTFPATAAADGDYNSIFSDDLIIETDADNLWDPVRREGWNGPYIDPGSQISVDADGDGLIETDYAFKIDPWDRYYYYTNFIVDEPGGQRRAVVIASGGPDRSLTTGDDLLQTVYYGELF
ncbi:prepilin-type N-terminal cleavage/methylation domain-containing protein [bacterium]|nr:prepilin-type N-terminal cleavage/methylation domain-containing protein [candidate division CSSED10-310 bacterium]